MELSLQHRSVVRLFTGLMLRNCREINISLCMSFVAFISSPLGDFELRSIFGR
jgi:hypothetical protein